MHEHVVPKARTMRNTKLLILIPLIAAASIRLIGIRHGEPDKVYHPDVAKQTQIAMALYDSEPLTLRQRYGDNIRFTLYPYGTAIILARASQGIARLTGDDTFGTVHRWRWALRMRYMSVAFFLVSLSFILLVLHRHLGPLATLATGLLLACEPPQLSLQSLRHERCSPRRTVIHRLGVQLPDDPRARSQATGSGSPGGTGDRPGLWDQVPGTSRRHRPPGRPGLDPEIATVAVVPSSSSSAPGWESWRVPSSRPRSCSRIRPTFLPNCRSS